MKKVRFPTHLDASVSFLGSVGSNLLIQVNLCLLVIWGLFCFVSLLFYLPLCFFSILYDA